MKKALVWFILCVPLFAKTAPLKKGDRYDFIAKDGQHIYDAEFVRETTTSYLVKAQGIGDELVTIEKDALAEPPRAILPGKPRPPRGPREKWSIAVLGDLRLANGAFSDYALFFPGFSARVARTMPRFPWLGFNSLWAGLQYSPIANSPRRIDMFTLALGPRWNFRWKKFKRADFFVSLAPTVSFFSYTSYSFTATSFNAGAVALFGVDYYLGKNWFLTASLSSQYVYDTTTFVLMHSLSAGAGYAW